jgi:hypothetical protein
MYNPFKQMSIPEYVVKRDHDQSFPDIEVEDQQQNKSFRASAYEKINIQERSCSRSKSNASRTSGIADDLADLVISY